MLSSKLYLKSHSAVKNHQPQALSWPSYLRIFDHLLCAMLCSMLGTETRSRHEPDMSQTLHPAGSHSGEGDGRLS